MENVSIDFREDALHAVAEKAVARKAGARGLRSILEEVLLDTMYDVPSDDGVEKVVIDASVVNRDSPPIVLRSTPDKQLRQ